MADEIKLTKEDKEFIEFVKGLDTTKGQKGRLIRMIKVNRQIMIMVSGGLKLEGSKGNKEE